MSNDSKEMLGWLGGIVVGGLVVSRLYESLKPVVVEGWNELKGDFVELMTLGEPESSTTVVEGSVSITDLMLPATFVGAGAAIGLGIEEGLRRYYRAKAKQRMEYFQVIPHAEYQINSERISNLAASFHQANRTVRHRVTRGREWFQLYFVCVPDPSRGEDGRIEIYCGFPRDRFSFVKKKLDQAFPQCGLKRVHWSKVPQLSSKGTGGLIQYQNKKRGGFPLQRFDGKDQMTAILDHLVPGSAMSIAFSPTTPRVLKKTMKQTRTDFYKDLGYKPKEIKKIRKSDLAPDVQQVIDYLNQRERKNRAFEVKMALWQEKESHGDVVASVRDELNSRLAGEYTGFRLKKTLRNPIDITPYSVYPLDWLLNMLDGIPYVIWNKPLVMLLQELENVLHLPAGMNVEQRRMKMKHLYDRIDYIFPGQSEIPHDEFTQGINFGNLLNPVQDYRPINLLHKVVRKHGTIIGGTGSGKTALAIMACQSIVLDRLKRKNGGLTIIDPKKTFAYTFATWLNKLKLEGVLTEDHEELFRFYDVTSDDLCFSINPMEKTKNMTRQQKHNVTRDTLEIMKSTFKGESILFEQYGGTAIKCLLEDTKHDHTLLAIPAFLEKESPLRDRLYTFLKNGDTYQKELAKEIERLDFGGRESQTVYNRLHRLRDNPRTKRIFGQTKTTISPLDAQQKGLITIYNIKGLEPEEVSLIMGYVLLEYHKSASKRNNHAENHLLFIDEAHRVQPEVLHKEIIPEDREFGLCLWLMTQAFHQFSDQLIDTIKDIGGTMISFKTGDKSAPVIERATTGRVKATDAMNYRSLTGACDTEDSKGDRRTIMIKSDPPFVWDAQGEKTYYGEDEQRETDEKNAAYANAWESIGRKWMERDCRSVPEVEKEIDEYMESLWKTPSESIRLTNKEAAAAKEGTNIVSFRPKEETKAEAQAVSENPFSRLAQQNSKEGAE